jgi:hypothetical protein
MAYGWLGAVGPLYGLCGRSTTEREDVLFDRSRESEGAPEGVGVEKIDPVSGFNGRFAEDDCRSTAICAGRALAGSGEVGDSEWFSRVSGEGCMGEFTGEASDSVRSMAF